MAATAMEGFSVEARLTEAKKIEYFSSINSMARKIMQEKEKIKDGFGSAWDDMTPVEQDSAIDDGMMEPKIRARYAMHRVERPEVQSYPKLLIQTGQKIVHFGDEDLTWQDEHSAPFSWETKSQLEFSMISGSSEPVTNSATESKPKTSQSVKLPAIEVSGSARRDEESSFWKLSAERSRLEGETSDFQSLTPSQIKSMEKGEKPLPSYLRNDSVPKDSHEPAPPRSVKQRVIKPPAPPPPAPISVTPAAIMVTPTPPAPQGGWEKSQSTLPSVSSTLDDVFTPSLTPKTKTEPVKKVEKDERLQATSPTFSQYNTSSAILKTGFDFLDNW